MKTQFTLQQLAKQIDNRSKAKVDYKANTKKIRLSKDGNSMLIGDKAFDLTQHAHSQITEYTKIPGPYYKRMREEAPDLLAANVHRWFDKEPKDRMVRTLGDKARAFLSATYNRMDDDAFAEVVLPVIMDVPGVEVVSCGMTDNKTHIKIKSPKFEREVQVGDPVQFGIAFSNSEVGLGRLSGSLFAYRLICNNGMIIEDEQFAAKHAFGRNDTGRDLGEIFKLDTLKADASATILKLRDYAGEMLTDKRIDDQVNRMRDSLGVKVEDPVGAVEVLCKKHTFTEGQGKSILTHLIEGGDLSAWGLMNAVTRAAEDQENYDEATRMEAIGGRMLTLSRTDYAELKMA